MQLILLLHDSWKESCTVTRQQQSDLCSSLTFPHSVHVQKCKHLFWKKVFIRRSLYPPPPARTAVAHALFALSTLSFRLIFIMLPRSIWCWADIVIIYISASIFFFLLFFVFAVCVDKCIIQHEMHSCCKSLSKKNWKQENSMAA